MGSEMCIRDRLYGPLQCDTLFGLFTLLMASGDIDYFAMAGCAYFCSSVRGVFYFRATGYQARATETSGPL